MLFINVEWGGGRITLWLVIKNIVKYPYKDW